jgi:hypothetical protein
MIVAYSAFAVEQRRCAYPPGAGFNLFEEFDVSSFGHLDGSRRNRQHNRPLAPGMQLFQGFLVVLVTGQRSSQLNYVPREGKLGGRSRI